MRLVGIVQSTQTYGMRNALILLCSLLAGCGGATIEPSNSAINGQLNTISRGIEEGSGRDAIEPAALTPNPGRPGIMPQEPPR